MSRLFPLAAGLPVACRAGRWLAGERWEEATARRASTVMLVRDGERGTEVFLLRRVAGMAFAPSMWVFPGGGVDPRGGDPLVPWSGPDPDEWARWLGCSPDEARSHVAAAVREVFEESGVLLAGAGTGGPLADVSDVRWRDIRDRLVRGEVSLGEVLEREGLLLRSDLLSVKAHWVTPRFEARRFDTWFFAALLPPGQVADGDTSEADRSGWVLPEELLAEYAGGQALMLPPTVVCLEEVRDAPSAAGFVCSSDCVPLLLPEVVDTPDGPAIRVATR